jgi:peroxiredoxin Q/BCP
VAYFAASVDRPERNRRFAESLELDYPILSDPDKDTARAYGVLKLGLFSARHTVYIDVDGKVLRVDRNVKARSAGDDLVRTLRELDVAPRVETGRD